MRKMTHPFFHDVSILVSVDVFLTHRFETVGVFAHFLCVKNAKTPSIWSSVYIYIYIYFFFFFLRIFWRDTPIIEINHTRLIDIFLVILERNTPVL